MRALSMCSSSPRRPVTQDVAAQRLPSGSHQVQLSDPDGEKIIVKISWDRGREYTAFFQPRKVGTYRLKCGTHAPSLTAMILVLPR